MPSRYDLSRHDLAALLEGEPAYRVDQLWDGMYRRRSNPESLTVFPKQLRARLSELSALTSALEPVVESVADDGRTIKWLYRLHDGLDIETVLMHYDDGRSTVCISSQAGCAMACGFCATGQSGFDRHLGVGEIVEQVIRAQRRCDDDSRRLTNLVFMGMGEPLANYDRVWAAIARVHGDLGIGARHITVSTVGIIPGIRRLAREDLPVNLAVSLHAANDELRSELVPINRRYPLSALTDACHAYLREKNRRLSFEWALIEDVNDRYSDAAELSEIALPLRAHVNVIPLNPTPGYLVRGSAPARVHDFAERLEALGVNVTIRQTRGVEIDAACGQLAARHASTAKRGVAIRSRR